MNTNEAFSIEPDTYINVVIADGEAYEQALKLAREAGAVSEGQRPSRLVLLREVWHAAA